MMSFDVLLRIVPERNDVLGAVRTFLASIWVSAGTRAWVVFGLTVVETNGIVIAESVSGLEAN
jgi:hypothetical protein